MVDREVAEGAEPPGCKCDEQRQVPNVYLVGPMGVGKTTIGRMLASDLGLEFIDSDVEIEARTGADIPWIFDVEGESGFRKRETEVIDDLSQREGVLIATGGGAILADINRSRLAARGVVVYLETTVATQMKRTKRDRKRPLLRSDLPRAEQRKVLEEMKRIRDPLYLDVAHLSVFVGDINGRKLVNTIKERLVQGGWIAEAKSDPDPDPDAPDTDGPDTDASDPDGPGLETSATDSRATDAPATDGPATDAEPKND